MYGLVLLKRSCKERIDTSASTSDIVYSKYIVLGLLYMIIIMNVKITIKKMVRDMCYIL